MKTEAEIKERLAACVLASDKFMSQSGASECPTGNGCCPECSTQSTLKWILDSHKQPKEAMNECKHVDAYDNLTQGNRPFAHAGLRFIHRRTVGKDRC